MTNAVASRLARGAASTDKLIVAATSILCAEGAAAVSVQRVADAAGTSKALVHYHFAGKDALLVACIEHVVARLTEIEDSATVASSTAAVLGDLWHAQMHPSARGLRRALLALTTDATPPLTIALARAEARRREAAMRTVERISHLLDFAPAVPRPVIALAYLALVDGLTLGSSVEGDTELRRAFDAFWLGVLSLES